MPLSNSPQQNHLLAALPEAERARLQTHLQPISMLLGKALYESGERQNYLYFPTTAIVSLLNVMEDGSSAEIAVVGNEGVLGISLFMAVRPHPAVRLCKARGMAIVCERR